MNRTDFFKKLLVILSALALSSCAGNSATVADYEVIGNKKPISLYKTLVINKFELARELYTSSTGNLDGRDATYAAVPDRLDKDFRQLISRKNLYQSVSDGGFVTDTTLILKGRFSRIGRFKISIIADLYDGGTGQLVASYASTLWDVYDATGSITDLAKDLADFIDRIQYK